MKLAPYSVALATSALFGASAGGQEMLIHKWKVTSETTTDQEGSSTKTEVEISFEPTDVDPTTGDFVVTTTCDGEQQIRLTIPSWGWEGNRFGGFSTISSDPIVNGTTLVVTHNGMDEEVLPSSMDGRIGNERDYAETSGTLPGTADCARLQADGISLEIGSAVGAVSGSDRGISVIESIFIAEPRPASGFIELSDEWRVTRNEEVTNVGIQTSAQMATGGVQIDPMQDGVEITWGDDNGSLVFRAPPWAFKQRFFSADLKDLQWQLNDGVPLEQLGVEFFFEDDLGNQTELDLSRADVNVDPGFSVEISVDFAQPVGGDFRLTGFGLRSGAFEAVFKNTDFGTMEFESELRLQVPDDVEICDNEIDDDGDGLIDFLDPDCNADPL